MSRPNYIRQSGRGGMSGTVECYAENLDKGGIANQPDHCAERTKKREKRK